MAPLVGGDPTTAAAAVTMRGLGDHFHRMAAAGLTANGLSVNGGGGQLFSKQERQPPPPSAASFAEEAANLVMPRHMLFPVHKYFQ